MRKIKTSRKKTRGKNMKKIFACLLSLSMIPTNGVAVFANDAATVVQQQETKESEIKVQSDDTQETEISFAQESLTSKIGCFQTYKFNGVDATQISSIRFKCNTDEYLSIYSQSIYDSKTKERSKGYIIYPKKEGTTEVTTTIRMKDGSSISVPTVELTVQRADDNVVPIIDYGLYSNLYHSYFYNEKEVGYITKEQLSGIKKIEINKNSSLISNLQGLSYATNCEELDLSGQSNIEDITELSEMTNLKKINLSDTKVSDISAISSLKDNLEYLNLENTNVSAKDRYAMMQSKGISIEAGTESTNIVYPKGIVNKGDKVVSENPNIVKAELKDTEDGGQEWVLQASDDQVGKKTKITVSNGNETKEIEVSVVEKDTNAPDFEQKSIDTSIGCFKEIKLKNTEDTNVKFISEQSNIATVKEDEYEHTYYLEPQGEGTTTIVGVFEKNGKKYTSKITVNISKLEDGIVPIKSYTIYSRLKGGYEEELPGKITERQLRFKDQLYLADCDLTNEDMDWISRAKYCRTLSLSNNPKISDISQLKTLYKLKILNLVNTSVEMSDDLKELSKQLEDLKVTGSKISTVDRFKLMRTNKISVVEGNKNESAVLPTGLIQAGDTCKIENEDVAEVTVGGENLYPHSREVCITAKAGQAGKTTNLIITAQDGTEKKIPVEVTNSNVGFAESKMEVAIGQFKEIDFKNADNIKEVTVDVAEEDSEKMKLVKSYKYTSSGKERAVYRLMPQKNEGTVKLIGTFTDNDGNVTKDTMTVTLTEDSNIVPIKSYALYTSLFVNEDTDEGRVSADVNGDYAISPRELAEVNEVRTEHSDVTDDDLKILKDAKNCEILSLGGEENITNIEFAKYMPKLEIIYINSTNVSDITPLNSVKDQLRRVRFDNTKISTKDRFSFIQGTTINVYEGTKQKINVQPEGIVQDDDKLNIDSDKFSIQKIEDWEEYDYEFLLDAMNAKCGDKGNLVVSNGDCEVKIPINVEKKANTTPGFKLDSKQLNIGHFEKIEFKNAENIQTSKISVEPATEADKKVVEAEVYYGYDTDEFYFVPRGEGEATLKATFSTEDGTVYTDYMKVSVKGVESEAYMPIKILSLCTDSRDENGKSVDKNGDFRLTKEEFSKITEVDLNGSWYITDEDLDILDSIKDQLTSLNIAQTFVSSAKRLSYIKTDAIMVKEGTMTTDLFGINGIVNYYDDTVEVEDSSIAEFHRDYDVDKGEEYGFVEAKDGKEGEMTNLVITTEDGITKKIPIIILGKDGLVSLKTILLDKNQVTLTKGETEKLVVSYQPQTATNKNVSWQSSDSSVVSVDKDGNITANKPGTAVITVEASNGSKAYCTVTVNDVQKQTPMQSTTAQPSTAAQKRVEKITVTAPSNKLSSGKKVKLTANISNDASNKNIKWTTSNKKYATVDKNGVVKFNKKAAGKTVIITAMATDGSGKKATFKIKIMKGSVQKITISGKKSVKAGKTLKLKAKVKASKGANKKLTWSSSNTKYATVSSSGTVKALKAGKKKSVKITAMATDGSGKKATVTIKIK